MKRATALLIALLWSSQVSAQENPNFNPDWGDEVLTHFGFGITLGIRFYPGDGYGMSLTDGVRPKNTFWFVGLEGTVGHKFGSACGIYDTGWYTGAGAGLDWVFGRGVTAVVDARVNYLAAFMSPGFGLGFAWHDGPNLFLAENLGPAVAHQLLFGRNTALGFGLSVPTGRAPIFTWLSDCAPYEG